LEGKEQEMKRRSFITGLLSAIPTISLASGIQIPTAISTSTSKFDYALNNRPTMIRVVESFPKTPVIDFSMPNRTHFLTMGNMKTSDQIGLRIEAGVVDPSQSFMLDKIFMEDDIEVLDFRDRNHTVSAIVSGANRIARKTRRGKGNYYAVFEDHVLVWYAGKSNFDAPAQMMGNNLAYHNNYKDYFVKVQCKDLTDEDHVHLNTIGFTKV
jgi:hypothetical protein